jgi:hypothetical protein
MGIAQVAQRRINRVSAQMRAGARGTRKIRRKFERRASIGYRLLVRIASNSRIQTRIRIRRELANARI